MPDQNETQNIDLKNENLAEGGSGAPLPVIIEPAVNRHVLYYPCKADGLITNGDEPLAAIIVSVDNQRRVNLAVFDAIGISCNAVDILLVQPMDELPTREFGYATWMDYQVGQAAKTEQLAEALEAAQEGKASAEEIRDGLADGEVIPGHQEGISE